MKQGRLPGTEDAAIQELEDAADEYMEARDKRLAHLKREVEKKGTILGIMQLPARRLHHPNSSGTREVVSP